MNPILSNGQMAQIFRAAADALERLEAAPPPAATSVGFDPDNLKHQEHLEPTLVGLGVARDRLAWRRAIYSKARGVSLDKVAEFVTRDVTEFRNRPRSPTQRA